MVQESNCQIGQKWSRRKRKRNKLVIRYGNVRDVCDTINYHQYNYGLIRKLCWLVLIILLTFIYDLNHFNLDQSEVSWFKIAQCSSAITTVQRLSNQNQNQNKVLSKNLEFSGSPNKDIIKLSGDKNNANKKLRPKVSSSSNESVKRFRNQSSTRNLHQDDTSNESSQQNGPKKLALSISPRINLMRVPVNSTAILQCLISSHIQQNNDKFDLIWSRYMYDEGIYEDLEIPSTSNSEWGQNNDNNNSNNKESNARSRRESSHRNSNSNNNNNNNNNNNDNNNIYSTFDRQQQIRDFQSRSRQEIRRISDLVIEASLSIISVKSSDNATYLCTATNHQGGERVARIDLVVLSKPEVALERAKPARDSKSALIYWSIISDGNAPIKRTILMVRNQTSFQQANKVDWRPFKPEESIEPTESLADFGDLQRHSTLVIDSDMKQWLKIDIEGDGSYDSSSEGLSNQANNVINQKGNSSPGGPIDLVSSADLSDIDITSSSDRPYNQQTGSGLDSLSGQVWHPGTGGSRRSRLNRLRSFNLTSLLPGISYNLKLAAVNDMGQSNWSELLISMPNDIPAQISEVFLLSRKSDSLVIGWRRPSYDTSKTIRYEMQLFDLNRTLTIDADTNIDQISATASPIQRTNFMYYFVNLAPGTDYHFHVRACSKFGCSDFSTPKLSVTTLDGEPDEPREVQVLCQFDSTRPNENKLTASWYPPMNPRGHLFNYTVLISARSTYRDQFNDIRLEEFNKTFSTIDKQERIVVHQFLRPNTNFTVRVCANNRLKHCGPLSTVTPNSQCSIPSSLPSELPTDIRLLNEPLRFGNSETGESETNKLSIETLVLELPHISMRNGTFDCIQIVLIRLVDSFDPKQSIRDLLPEYPSEVELITSIDDLVQRTSNSQTDLDTKNFTETSQDQDHAERAEFAQKISDNSSPNQHVTRRILIADESKRSKINLNDDSRKILAYVADEIDDSRWQWNRVSKGQAQQITLGDGQHYQCPSLISLHQSNLAGKKSKQSNIAPAFDAQLATQTYYTGFIKLIQVRSLSRSSSKRSLVEEDRVVTKYSDYFEPVRTGDSVPQVSGHFGTARGNKAENIFGGILMSTPLSFDSLAMDNIREFGRKLGSNIWYNYISKWYDSVSVFVMEKGSLESISHLIMSSSPMMQLLEIGLIVIGVTLFMLLLVYFITLGSSSKKRQRRRATRSAKLGKEKISKEFCKHDAFDGEKQQAKELLESGLHTERRYSIPDNVNVQCNQKQQQQSNIELDESGLAVEAKVNANGLSEMQQYKAHQHQVAPNYGLNTECPIHSSPGMHPEEMQMLKQRASIAAYHTHDYQNRQYERNCRTTRRLNATGTEQGFYGYRADDQGQVANEMTLNHQHNSVLALAKRISKPIPLRLFSSVYDFRLQNGWLREEYEQLPRSSLVSQLNGGKLMKPSSFIQLQPELIVSRSFRDKTKQQSNGDDTENLGQNGSQTEGKISALISGNDRYDASIIKPFNSMGGESVSSNIICARSPLDADSVWDFWRLVLEREVSTLVMLTHTEDLQSGELRCVQYWPICDNEETTILSPCNEFVQKSSIPPAKFKIRQETLEASSSGIYETSGSGSTFKVRRLTLMVLPSRASDNQSEDQEGQPAEHGAGEEGASQNQDEDDEEEVVIVERDILHLQFTHWNMSSLANQMRLIKFVELANERHLRSQSTSEPNMMRPMLVHCTNGLGRSGLFTAMSLIIDELSIKLQCERQLMMPNANRGDGYGQQEQQQQHSVAKINLFQLVSRLRVQREMLLSPYRFYELLYQLTSNCIPSQQDLKQFLYSRGQSQLNRSANE